LCIAKRYYLNSYKSTLIIIIYLNQNVGTNTLILTLLCLSRMLHFAVPSYYFHLSNITCKHARLLNRRFLYKRLQLALTAAQEFSCALFAD